MLAQLAGNTQFMSSTSSILLNYSLSEVRAPPQEGRLTPPEEWGGVKVGHMWADASEDELVTSFGALYSDAHLRDSLGVKARRQVAEAFSYGALARQAVALLRGLESDWEQLILRRQATRTSPQCSAAKKPLSRSSYDADYRYDVHDDDSDLGDERDYFVGGQGVDHGGGGAASYVYGNTALGKYYSPSFGLSSVPDYVGPARRSSYAASRSLSPDVSTATGASINSLNVPSDYYSELLSKDIYL